MPTYVCYGLTVQSELELPELGAALTDRPRADVVIELGTLSERPTTAVELVPGLWREATVCGVEVPGVARFEARSGNHIVVDPSPDSGARDVRLFLLGTVMGAIMMQRDHLVLHGNAVRVGDGCAVVVGHSGAGKSTLAAEFVRRGLEVLSDDVVPVDACGRALAGYPRIKLWGDAIARLGLDTAGYERLRPGFDKFNVPIERSELAAVPLDCVYVLDIHDSPDLELSPATGIEKFELLRAHTYRSELIFDRATTVQHARQCAALGARAAMVRVRRPAATMTAESTADAILSDLQVRHDSPSRPAAEDTR